MNYYNEIDPFAAQWLRNLIAAGHIAPGVVDERDIRDVLPTELALYRQCHFFAGIGVWSYALRLAGWPDDRPVWTGSCPCQPFSTAGGGKGFADQRHLWPAWYHLIAQCKPSALFGEQVASKSADTWIDLVQADLEILGYAVGVCPFPSAGVGAPHVRDRLYWLGDCERARLEGYGRDGGHVDQRGRIDAQQVGSIGPTSVLGEVAQDSAAGEVNGFWSDADWLGCRDGRYRPVEPGTFPLADGVAARVGRLRAYGNAINAQQAAEFIRASQ